MGDRWIWGYQSVGFAKQVDLTTENSTDGDFYYFKGAVDTPDFVRAIEDLQYATGQVGAYEPPVPGSKHGGTFSVKMPARIFKSNYAPTAEEPGVSNGVVDPSLVLLGNALGSNAETPATAAAFRNGQGLSYTNYTGSALAATYQANAVAAHTASTVTVAAGTGPVYKVGQLVLFDDGTALGVAPTVGWIKSIAGDVLTLTEDAGNEAANADEGYATAVAFLSQDEPVPVTFRLLGSATATKLALVGCICSGGKLSLKAGMTPMLEMKYTFEKPIFYSTGGGLVSSSGAWLNALPILPANGGRLTYGTSGAAGAVTCGFADLEISWESTTAYLECHNAGEGYSEAVTTGRKVTISATIPHDTDDAIVGGESIWQALLSNSTAKTLSVFTGLSPGQIFAVFAASMHLESAPKLESRDGLLFHKLVWRLGTYSSDGAAVVGTPGNRILRVGGA